MPGQDSTLEFVLRFKNEAEAALKAAGQNLNTLGKEAKVADTGIKEVDRSAKEAKKSFGEMASAIAGVVAAAATLRGSANGFREFEKGTTNIQTLMPEAGARVSEIGNKLRDLALDSGTSTKVLVDGAYQVVSAFGNTANTFDIVKIANEAAVGGLSTTTDAVNLLSAVSKGYGDTSVEMIRHISDLAFTTVKLGQTTFPELARSMGSVVPFAKTLNVSVEEVFGVMSTLTGVTGNTAEVSTQFKGVLTSLLKPLPELEKVYKGLGVASGEALVKQVGFAGALKKIEAEGRKQGIAMKDLIGRDEALTAVLALTGEQYDTLIAKTKEVTETAGSASKAFQIQAMTLDNAMSRIGRVADEVGMILGESLAPSLHMVADVLQDTMKWFRTLDPQMQQAIATAATTALGLISLAGAFTLVSSAMSAMSVARMGLPVGWIIAGVAAITAALVYFSDDLGLTRDDFVQAWADMKTALTDFSDTFLGEMDGIRNYFAQYADDFDRFTGRIGDAIRSMLPKVDTSGIDYSDSFSVQTGSGEGGTTTAPGQGNGIGDFIARGIAARKAKREAEEYWASFDDMMNQPYKSSTPKATNGGADNPIVTISEEVLAAQKALDGFKRSRTQALDLLAAEATGNQELVDQLKARQAAENAAQATVDEANKAKGAEKQRLLDIAASIRTVVEETTNATTATSRYKTILTQLGTIDPTMAATNAKKQMQLLQSVKVPGTDTPAVSDAQAQAMLKVQARAALGGKATAAQAQESYNKQIDAIKAWAQVGAQLADEVQTRMREAYMTMLEAQTDWSSGVERGMNKFVTSAMDSASVAEKAITDAANGMADTMGQFLTGQIASWSDFGDAVASILQNIAGQMASMMIKQSVIVPLMSAMGFAAAAQGRVFNAGQVTAFASGGAFSNSVVSNPTLAPMALFGEAGPEAIMPLARDSSGNLGVRAVSGTTTSNGNGSTTVLWQPTYEFTVEGGLGGSDGGGSDDGSTMSLLRTIDNRVRTVVVETLQEQKRSGGALSNTLEM